MPDRSSDQKPNDDLKTYIMDASEWDEHSSPPVAEKTPPTAPPRTDQEPFSLLTPPNPLTPRPDSGSSPRTPTDLASSEYDLPLNPATGTLQIKVGAEIFDDYLVEEKIGEGGMGSVWKVMNHGLGASTALKVIVETNFTDEARERLKREAQLMARIKHPNAVHVLHSKVRREFAFIEMEYLKGKSIDRIIERGRPMEMGWIARILEQLCGVLEYAHERVTDNKNRPVKIVHRDLKPSNLMILEDTTGGPYFLKVLDFGIAKKVELQASAADPAEFRTHTGGTLFTLPYASPEQIGGQRDVSEKTDIYSVGVMLYEFITGYRPFEEPGLIYKQISLPPPPFKEKNPAVNVSPEIEAIVMRCLSKNPLERPSASELANDFFAALPADLVIPTAKPSSRLTGEFSRTPSTITRRTGGSSQGSSTQEHRRVADEATQRADEPRGSADRTQVGTQSVPSWKDERTKVKTATLLLKSQRRPGKKSPVPVIIGGIILLCTTVAVALVIMWANKRKPSDIQPVDPVVVVPKASVSRIPKGYEAVTSAGKIDEFPRIIQRENTDIRFIYIPGEPFKMGVDRSDEAYTSRFKGLEPDKAPPPIEGYDLNDDLPQRDVMVTGFYIQETEVTNGEIYTFLNGRPLADRDRWQRFCNSSNLRAMRDKPAICVSKATARAYAQLVGGDLPTELQWEYTARSGDRSFRPYVWKKKNLLPIDIRTNLNLEGGVGNAADSLKNVTESTEDITDYNVRGMMGNVREWCLDDWAPYPVEGASGPRDPVRDFVHFANGPKKQSVVRGASFRSLADRCQTTWPRRLMEEHDKPTLDQIKENDNADDIGFRVVLKLPEVK